MKSNPPFVSNLGFEVVKFSEFNAEVASTIGFDAGKALKSKPGIFFKFEVVSTIGVLVVKSFGLMRSAPEVIASNDWPYPLFFPFSEVVLLYSPN